MTTDQPLLPGHAVRIVIGKGVWPGYATVRRVLPDGRVRVSWGLAVYDLWPSDLVRVAPDGAALGGGA